MKKLMMTATLFCVTTLLMANTPMLRLEVREYESNPDEPTTINLSLPLTMIEAVRPQIAGALDDINIDGQDLDLRAIWQEIRNAGPNDYVEIKDAENDVKVSTTESHIVIKVTENDGQNVDISIPLALGDALLGGETVDEEALIDALYALQGQDLLSVVGDDVNVRAWIE